MGELEEETINNIHSFISDLKRFEDRVEYLEGTETGPWKTKSYLELIRDMYWWSFEIRIFFEENYEIDENCEVFPIEKENEDDEIFVRNLRHIKSLIH